MWGGTCSNARGQTVFLGRRHFAFATIAEAKGKRKPMVRILNFPPMRENAVDRASGKFSERE